MAFDAGAVKGDIFLDTNPLARSIARSNSMMSGLERSTRGVFKAIASQTVKLGSALTAAFGGISIGVGLKLAAEFEAAQVSFQTMLGDADKAKNLMKELEAFAASTPFQFPELIGAGRSLLAFGTDAKDVIPELRTLGDLSAGLNIPIRELSEIYGKARVQGRLFMEDINQLTGRGIPIIGELAKQFGVTQGEVRELVSAGRVEFGHLQTAFRDLTAEGSKFGGGMAAQSKTLAGLWSTFKDNVSAQLRAVGVVLVEQLDLKSVLAGVTTGIQQLTPKIVGVVRVIFEGATAVRRWIDQNIELVSSLGAITATAAGLALSIKGVTLAVRMAGNAAAIAWAKALGPITLVVGGIAAVGAGIALALGEGERWTDRLGNGFVKMATYVVKAGVGAFTAVEVAVLNWGTTMELGSKSVQLAMLTSWEEIKYTFGTRIPVLWEWFGRNWHRLLGDMSRLHVTAMQNIWQNSVGVGRKVWDFLSGIDWQGAWSGMLEGVMNVGIKINDFFSNLFEGIWSFISDPSNWKKGTANISEAIGAEMVKLLANTKSAWDQPEDFKFKGLTEGFEFTTEPLPEELSRSLTSKEAELAAQIGKLGTVLGNEFHAKMGPRVQAALEALGLVDKAIKSTEAGEGFRVDLQRPAFSSPADTDMQERAFAPNRLSKMIMAGSAEAQALAYDQGRGGGGPKSIDKQQVDELKAIQQRIGELITVTRQMIPGPLKELVGV